MSDYDHDIKVTLFGESNIGKLTLCSNFSDYFGSERYPGLHVWVKTLIFDELRVRLSTIDCAFVDDQVALHPYEIIALVEAKRKGNSVFYAFQQAKDYAKAKPAINRLIVTDGIRYGVYLKRGENWHLHAYMNLTRFQKEYKIYACLGILEALWVMSPEWTKG